MAVASLVPFQGPKKSRFSGPTPSNDPHNDVAPLKTITYRAIKTTGTLIVITRPVGFVPHFIIIMTLSENFIRLATKTKGKWTLHIVYKRKSGGDQEDDKWLVVWTAANEFHLPF